MNKWKPTVALILVFVAGFAMGVMATRMVVRRVVNQMLNDPQMAQQRAVGQLELRLSNQLELSPVQQREVRQILRQAQQQIRGIRQASQPRIAEVNSNAAAQIRLVLTTEQQQRFEKMQETGRFPGLGRGIPPVF